MQINPQAMPLIILGFVIFILWYQVRLNSTRILCIFRGRNKTRVERFAKDSQARIVFEDGYYDVDPGRITIGIRSIFFIFPLPIRCLDFRHDSAKALHPDTFENQMTAEERKQLDTADSIKEYSQGSRQGLMGRGKMGLLERYQGIITVIGFVIIAFVIYNLMQKIDLLGTQGNVIQGTLAQIQQALKK